MNTTEMANYLGVTESSLKKNFTQIKKSKAKQGINITKEGRGDKTEYFVNIQPFSSFYNSKSEKLYFDDNFFKLPNFCTLVAFAMVMINSQQTAISMTYSDFLKYIEIEPTHRNIQTLKEALEHMSDENLINYMPDKRTPDKAFLASWVYDVQQQYKVQIEFFAECKKLIEKHDKSQR